MAEVQQRIELRNGQIEAFLGQQLQEVPLPKPAKLEGSAPDLIERVHT